LIGNDKAAGDLLVANLPPAPAGKAYELWTLGGPAPRPAGVFQVDASGCAVQRVEPAAGASGFAVTLEPAAGSPAPTGPGVLAARSIALKHSRRSARTPPRVGPATRA